MGIDVLRIVLEWRPFENSFFSYASENFWIEKPLRRGDLGVYKLERKFRPSSSIER